MLWWIQGSGIVGTASNRCMVLTYLSRRYSRYRQDVWCYDDFPPRGTYTPASVFFPKRFSLNFLRLVFIFIITFFRVIIIKSKSSPAQYFHIKSNIMSVLYLKSIKSFLKNIAHSQPISCLLKTQTFFWLFFNGPLILDVTHFGSPRHICRSIIRILSGKAVWPESTHQTVFDFKESRRYMNPKQYNMII